MSTDILYIAGGYSLIETIMLIIIWVILKRFKMVVPWKLIIYGLISVIISLFLNFILSSLKIHIGDPQQKNLLLFSVLVVFTVLVFFNITASKVVFVLEAWKACLLGMLMGLINTFMVLTSITFYK